MEVHILKENLSKAIQAALRFTSSRTQMPILANVLLEASDKGIYLSATNLEVGLKLRVAGKIVTQGSVVVSARVLSDLVQHLPLGGVKLIASDGGLQVQAGGVKARLQTNQIEDFPPFLPWKNKTGVLKVGLMQKAFDKVGYAVSSDEARPVLTGFLWLVDEKSLIATDGYRLSVVDRVEAWDVAKKQERLLVPGKSMIQVMQTLEDFGVEECDFQYDDKAQQLLFLGQEMVLSIRILAGDYPQYEAILPKASTIEAQAAREELLEAVRAAAIFARDGANIVRLTIEGKKMIVSANAAQVGENTVEVELEEIKTGEISIAFNSKYLIDFLTHSASEKVSVGFTDPLKPGLFSEVGDESYRHVIMPVRVRETA